MELIGQILNTEQFKVVLIGCLGILTLLVWALFQEDLRKQRDLIVNFIQVVFFFPVFFVFLALVMGVRI